MLAGSDAYFNVRGDPPPGPRSDEPQGDLRQWALTYRSWGWSVFYLFTKTRPAYRWKPWQERRPTDRDLGRFHDLAVRLGRKKGQGVTGVAVVNGRVSGCHGRGCLCCRDFDDADAYARWSAEHPELARTLPTVRTFRGYHVYALLTAERFVGKPLLGDSELRADALHYNAL